MPCADGLDEGHGALMVRARYRGRKRSCRGLDGFPSEKGHLFEKGLAVEKVEGALGAFGVPGVAGRRQDLGDDVGCRSCGDDGGFGAARVEELLARCCLICGDEDGADRHRPVGHDGELGGEAIDGAEHTTGIDGGECEHRGREGLVGEVGHRAEQKREPKRRALELARSGPLAVACDGDSAPCARGVKSFRTLEEGGVAHRESPDRRGAGGRGSGERSGTGVGSQRNGFRSGRPERGALTIDGHEQRFAGSRDGGGVARSGGWHHGKRRAVCKAARSSGSSSAAERSAWSLRSGLVTGPTSARAPATTPRRDGDRRCLRRSPRARTGALRSRGRAR